MKQEHISYRAFPIALPPFPMKPYKAVIHGVVFVV